MQKKYKKSLFLFHRDLRVIDNTGLLEALRSCQSVIALFILDPVQVGAKNKYKSDNAVQFMVESLQDLGQQVKLHGGYLHVLYGNTHKILTDIFKEHVIDAFFCNIDYTPFALERDDQIKQLCQEYDVLFHGFHDALLQEPLAVLKKDGTPYTMFTPFYKKTAMTSVRTIDEYVEKHFSKRVLQNCVSHNTIGLTIHEIKNARIHVHGGRAEGKKLLKAMADIDYKKTHDFPTESTTYLSAHLKFGTLSLREMFSSCKKLGTNGQALIRQLYWRDFFTQIAYHFPHVFGHAFHKKYDAIAWNNDKKTFQTWCEGTTGFPIVDAGMRQLNATGFMHNRVRMIVASFLIKDLHIDWRWGERYFAQKLVDYDPAVNNGNWQWVASTGCDAQPYFRIFNPWLQQKKFDPECDYIKQWVPELHDVSAAIIHTWYKNKVVVRGYPQPMVDHATESVVAKRMYVK